MSAPSLFSLPRFGEHRGPHCLPHEGGAVGPVVCQEGRAWLPRALNSSMAWSHCRLPVWQQLPTQGKTPSSRNSPRA